MDARPPFGSSVPKRGSPYAVFGVFLGAAVLFAHPAIVSAIYAGSRVLVRLLFAPLLAESQA
jgi:hypothetical protein